MKRAQLFGVQRVDVRGPARSRRPAAHRDRADSHPACAATCAAPLPGARGSRRSSPCGRCAGVSRGSAARRPRALRPSCAGTACPCRGRSGWDRGCRRRSGRCPAIDSSAVDCTSSARTPYSNACLSGCRRPQIGSPSAIASRNGARRGSPAGIDCHQSASSRPATGAKVTMRTRSPWKSSSSVAAIARSVVAGVSCRIRSNASWCVRTARRSFSCALANNSCRRRASSRFLSRNTSSW